jgi:glycosyltransferase involved in cell wall biosynthesis
MESNISYTLESEEKDLSIIVPMYNEERNIQLLYESIHQAISPLGINYEILFVDDGSEDGTFDLAKELALRDSRIRVIKLRKNYGQTPAMAAGIDMARGKTLITMDGDLQNDPSDIKELLGQIREGYDLVCGWRVKRQDKLFTRKIPSWIANWLIGKITGIPIKDNGCTLKAYRADMIKKIPLYSDMHRYIPAMASIVGSRISQIPVRHHARKFGKTKYGFSRIYKILLDIFMIKTLVSFTLRPMLCFAILGSFAGFFCLVGVTSSLFSAIYRPDTSIVLTIESAILFGSLAIFLFFSGALCELINNTGNIKIHTLARINASYVDVESKE